MTARDLIDRADLTEVWHALGGGDLRHWRGLAFWRRGADGWNVSLDPARGLWYDHARVEGGGVLDLVQTVRGGSRGDALRWLADHLGVDLDGGARRTPAERRRMDEERADLARAQHWRRGRMAGLEQAKADATAADFSQLAGYARELWTLQQARGSVLLDQWRIAVRADPEGAADCEEWGAEDEAQAAALTGMAVAILAAVEQRDPVCQPPAEASAA